MTTSARVALFEVAANPDPDSTLPFLIRLPLPDGELVLKARDSWPQTAKVCCHRAEQWPQKPEIVERVPIRPANGAVSRSTWCSTARARTAPSSTPVANLERQRLSFCFGPRPTRSESLARHTTPLIAPERGHLKTHGDASWGRKR